MKEYLKKISLVLATCTFLFSCDKFLEENPKDKLPEDDVYNSISEVYLNAVASLYTYVGGYSDSQGLQGTGRGVYDLNTFTTMKLLSLRAVATGTTVAFGRDYFSMIGVLRMMPFKLHGSIFIKS